MYWRRAAPGREEPQVEITKKRISIEHSKVQGMSSESELDIKGMDSMGVSGDLRVVPS